jgi:hypothetical protein
MTRPALFIDDGGVMNVNARRGRQWQRLVGGYFSPRLGGAPEVWAAANAHVANRLFAEYETHFDADPGASFYKVLGHLPACLAQGHVLRRRRGAARGPCRRVTPLPRLRILRHPPRTGGASRDGSRGTQAARCRVCAPAPGRSQAAQQRPTVGRLLSDAQGPIRVNTPCETTAVITPQPITSGERTLE